MAPSSGHLLVPKAIRIIQYAVSKTASIVRSKLPQSNTAATANAHLQPIRVYARNQPIHPLAYLKQARSQQSRWFSSKPRAFTSSASRSASRYDRSTFPVSRTSKEISKRGLAPFASTLRPSLTGGTLSRTAGGYSFGGAGKGVRHFSHTPSCQAQVLQNVHAGIRAFYVNGSKARFDGTDPATGEKRFRTISPAEDKIYQQWEKTAPSTTTLTKGTNLEFHLSPTITALFPSSSPATQSDHSLSTLQTPTLLQTLSSDFAHTLRTLSQIHHDLTLLSRFGALPLSLAQTPQGPILSLRFPGCDASSVAHLCDEVGVMRGIIVEDAAWDESREVEMALLFPLAPGPSSSPGSNDAGDYFAVSAPPPCYRERDDIEIESMFSPSVPVNRPATSSSTVPTSAPLVLGSPSYCESLVGDDVFDSSASPLSNKRQNQRKGDPETPSTRNSQGEEYEGLEGIYRFLRECEEAKRA